MTFVGLVPVGHNLVKTKEEKRGDVYKDTVIQQDKLSVKRRHATTVIVNRGTKKKREFPENVVSSLDTVSCSTLRLRVILYVFFFFQPYGNFLILYR